MSLVVGLAAFGGGLWLLVAAVDGLIGSLRAWALAAGLPGVLVGALVLGLDLESAATGIAATLDGLPGTALGATVGAAAFLVTAGLGIAGLVAPFAVRTPVALLATAAAATAVCLGVALDGRLARLDGVVLLGAFAACLAAVVRFTPRAGAAADPAERPRRLVLRVLLGLAGLVAGAELLVLGTGRIVAELNLSETVFGLLVVGAAVSFEEVVLEALPAFRGFPELSVGNALGTLVFLLTGSLGVVVLVRPLPVPGVVTAYHLPALAGAVLLALGVLARGRVGRVEGAVLLLAYAVYAAGALLG